MTDRQMHCKRVPSYLPIEDFLYPTGLYKAIEPRFKVKYKWMLFSLNFEIEDLEEYLLSIRAYQAACASAYSYSGVLDTNNHVKLFPLDSTVVLPGTVFFVTDEWVCSDPIQEPPMVQTLVNIWQKALYQDDIFWVRKSLNYIESKKAWVPDSEVCSPIEPVLL